MTRIVVGPINRVEGDLEVTLDIAEGRVREARVTASLYRGFEQILEGRPAGDALVIAPRICGICSVSQSVAAAAALRDAHAISPAENGLYATAIAHAAENLADHLSHFYLFFMPDFAREAYADRPWHAAAVDRFGAINGTASREFLPARARLLHVLGILAGKWPHSLAFQPGGTTRAIDLGERVRLLAVIAEIRGFLERIVFAGPLDRFLALEAANDLTGHLTGPAAAGDLAAFFRYADDLGLAARGRGPGLMMSYGAYHLPESTFLPSGLFDCATDTAIPLDPAGISEDVAESWLLGPAAHPSHGVTQPDPDMKSGYSWAKAPRLAGQCAEVGALARQLVAGRPLIRDFVGRYGPGVSARILARLAESAMLVVAMEKWIKALRPREPFCSNDEWPRTRDSGTGVGLVEAARGSLGHWLDLRDGHIRNYQIVAPTTWNFSPRNAAGTPGPLEQALVGTPVGDLGAKAPAVQHVVRSFDPCMVCTAH